MAAEKQGQNNNILRWLAGLVLVVLIPLVISFNGRMAIIRQMHQEERQLAQDIAKEQARREELEALREYVNSDAYVEHWARVEARMARPGEVTFIPVRREPVEEALLPSSAPAPVIQTSPLDEWWAVFFNPPAP